MEKIISLLIAIVYLSAAHITIKIVRLTFDKRLEKIDFYEKILAAIANSMLNNQDKTSLSKDILDAIKRVETSESKKLP